MTTEQLQDEAEKSMSIFLEHLNLSKARIDLDLMAERPLTMVISFWLQKIDREEMKAAASILTKAKSDHGTFMPAGSFYQFKNKMLTNFFCIINSPHTLSVFVWAFWLLLVPGRSQIYYYIYMSVDVLACADADSCFCGCVCGQWLSNIFRRLTHTQSHWSWRQECISAYMYINLGLWERKGPSKSSFAGPQHPNSPGLRVADIGQNIILHPAKNLKFWHFERMFVKRIKHFSIISSYIIFYNFIISNVLFVKENARLNFCNYTQSRILRLRIGLTSGVEWLLSQICKYPEFYIQHSGLSQHFLIFWFLLLKPLFNCHLRAYVYNCHQEE